MGEVFIWRLFNQLVINPFVWGAPTDEAVVRKAIDEEIPEILDYLETELPADGYLFEDISVADISVATFFRNAAFAGFSVDRARWPITAAFVHRLLDHPGFAQLRPFEDLLIRTPIPAHRNALREAGAPLTQKTLASDIPRRGIISI
jgi:glutathione S-transferase